MSRNNSDKDELLPYGRHQIDDADIAAVTAVLRSDRLTTGPATEDFERAFAETVGTQHVVACSSGTAALHLACLANDIKAGDVVIVPSVTFLATANASRFVGADVVFADCDPESGLMRVVDLEQAIALAGQSAKAVFPVHLNGQVADVEGIAAVARQHEMVIIEDGCHALGTTYQSKNGNSHDVGSCSFSDITTFSFHPVKTIAMGEGGAITTNDTELAGRMRLYRNHGMVRDPARMSQPLYANDSQNLPNPWYYEMQLLGYNYRPSDIHCALGLSQLQKLADFSKARRQLMQCYDHALAELAPVVKPVKRVSGCDPVLHLYPVLIDFKAVDIERSEVMRRLEQMNIGTQVHYRPVHQQPYYRNLYGQQSLPGAEAYYDKVLSLPFFPDLTEADVSRIVAALRSILHL